MLRFKSLVFVLLVLALAGCVSNGPVDRTVVVPPMLDLNMDDLLPDQQLVLASLIERLHGNGPVGSVIFEPAGVQATVEEEFKYEGFGLAGMVISGYDVKPFGEDAAAAYLDGGLLFKDELGRRVGVRFAVNYVVYEDRIVIRDSAVTPRNPEFPNVQAFYLPGSFTEIPVGEVETMADLYVWTVNHAVPMGSAVSGASFPEEEYTILVFCMDRLRPEASFEVAVTQSKGGGMKLGDMEYIVDRGWRTGLIVAEFTPNSGRSRFYIRAKYNPAPEDGGQELLVGLFSNKGGGETSPAN